MATRTDTAYVEGLKELRRILRPPDELLAEPWKRAMTNLSEAGGQAALNAAPVKSGLLRRKIYAKVQKKPFPQWAAARARGTRKSAKYPKGYPYPRLLEFSQRHGHKGWFTTAVQQAWNQADAVLAKAGNEIQEIWKRGR